MIGQKEIDMHSPFAKLSDVKPGTRLKADDGFDCITDGEVLTVAEDDGGLYVPCTRGHHYLDGRRNYNDELVGFWEWRPL